MTPAYWPIPPQPNAYFDEVNKRLGASVTFTIVAGNDYKEKLAAITAASNVPDLTVVTQWDQPARMSEAAPKVFADLTEHLRGDKVRRFPNLANLPTASWSMGVFGGRLYAVPFPDGLFLDQLFYRADILAELGEGPPGNADELLALAKRVTDARRGRWGAGDMMIEAQRLYGVQVAWRKDSSGRLVHSYETPEYEEATAFTRKFFEQELVHPDVVAGRTDGLKDLFESGKMVMYVDGLGAWHEAVQRQKSAGNDAFDMRVFPPYSAAGIPPGYLVADPARIFCFVSAKVPPERIDQLLGILDFCAAPFGTEEHYLVNYGVEGVHHTRGPDGVPQLNKKGTTEVTPTYFFLAGRPDALTQVQIPDFVRARHEWESLAVNHQVKQLYHGMRVEEPARFAGNNGINQPLVDKTKDIYLGRAPVSDLKTAVAEWRRRGGDELRDFYAKVLADAGR